VVRALAERTKAKVLTFGSSPDATVHAEAIALDEAGRAAFDLIAEADRERVELSVPGEHMISNALAAAACGIALGLSVAECAAGLKGVHVSRWRMETFTTAEGVVIVNDAYNANPESMGAGLRAARWMARDGRLVAVLGYMAELGPISVQEHERLGELVVRLGVDRVVTVGEEARRVARAAVREGALPESVASFDHAEDAAADVRRWARPGDVVLIKGSRVVGLERVAEALR
jgi:UDP-N-acetylmuramoyl-tripeptide--D-alanyl-D-alanine ligase